MTRAVPTLLVAALILAACSSENPKPAIGKGLPTLLDELRLRKKPAPAQPSNPLAGLTRAQLAGLPGPLLAAHLEDVDSWATLSPIAVNSGVTTFVTPDAITVSLKDGLVVATRGLAGDLISSDPTAATAAVGRKPGARYTRRMSWLDGEDQTVSMTYDCTLEQGDSARVEIVEQIHETRLWRESCQGAGGAFVNDYYIGQGVIWTSRQWLGPDAGYLNLTVLIRG